MVLTSLIQIYFFVTNTLFIQSTRPLTMDKFLYFAYGSNMLAQRIHINNPTAVRIGHGKLNV